ncbi:MAG: hypothetical protein OXN17_11380 [Candidatus Poribacteria bacterium]|nr:hypothetical protein [Candidatus Poribacteria bacterium]MDE0502648.1 hypothetical protein [Candidatus Poribacteria bacterium]
MPRTIGLCLFFFILGCSDRNTPENVAGDFIHNYYQRADQEAALRLSDSLAAEKLKDEIALVRGARRQGGLPTEMPEIIFEKLTQKTDGANMVFFNYRLTIKNTASSSPARNVIIITELIDGKWKITNFDEYAD